MTLTVSNTTCVNNPAVTWWLNADGENPCEMLANLLKRCDKKFTLGNIPLKPFTDHQICSDAAIASGDAPDVAECCCNSVAYSLRQACWSCQWGAEDPDTLSGNSRPTFGEYLQCQETGALNNASIGIAEEPAWTKIPYLTADTWKFENVERFALQNDTQNVPIPANPANPDPAESGQTALGSIPAPGMQPPAIVAIVGGLVALCVILAGLFIWCTVRKHRRRLEKTGEDVSPYPGPPGDSRWRISALFLPKDGLPPPKGEMRSAYPFSPDHMRTAQYPASIDPENPPAYASPANGSSSPRSPPDLKRRPM